MTAQEPQFAVAEEMKRNTAELAKSRETVEKLTGALDSVAKSVDNLVLSLNFQKANTIPKQTGPQEAAPLKTTDTTPAPRAINWRKFKTGTPGGWCYTNENEPLRDTLLAAKSRGQMSVVLENHTYRLSGDEDQFIQRFPVGPKK